MTAVQSPENNGSVPTVDGTTGGLFHEPHRAEAVKTTMGSKVAAPSNDQVANNQQNKSNNTTVNLLSSSSLPSDGGHTPVSSSGKSYDPTRKRCSISVHSQHNHQHSAGAAAAAGVNSSNGDAIRPGGGGGGIRELSPQSLRIHRKSSHDIRILGADGEMLLHEAGGKMPTVVKPIKLKSICTKAESYDTLHGRATDVSKLLLQCDGGCAGLPTVAFRSSRRS